MAVKQVRGFKKQASASGGFEFIAWCRSGRFLVYKNPVYPYKWTANFKRNNGDFIYGFGNFETPRGAMLACRESKYYVLDMDYTQIKIQGD